MMRGDARKRLAEAGRHRSFAEVDSPSMAHHISTMVAAACPGCSIYVGRHRR